MHNDDPLFTARRKSVFDSHKQHAKRRGIPSLLTFEEWWSIWEASGRWAEHGPLAHQYCMSRFDDLGFYEVGNVEIITNRANRLQMKSHQLARWGNQHLLGHRHSEETKAKMRAARLRNLKNPSSSGTSDI